LLPMLGRATEKNVVLSIKKRKKKKDAGILSRKKGALPPPPIWEDLRKRDHIDGLH